MDLHCCILCKQTSVQQWFVRTTDTVDYPIVRCDSCKSAYAWPRPSAREVQQIYTGELVNPASLRQGLYWPTGQADGARLFATFAPKGNGKVLLDLGAGTGVATEEAIRRGFSVRACEPDQCHRKEFLQRNGFEPDPRFFDRDFAEESTNQIDAVLLSHVLEHIPDPESLLENLRIVLRQNGIVIIAVPLFGSILTAIMGKRDFFITPPEHLTYFSYAGLTELLRRNGFSVDSMFTSPKVNMLRYRNRLGLACYGVNLAAYGVLKLSEAIDRSIVLNVRARLV